MQDPNAHRYMGDNHTLSPSQTQFPTSHQPPTPSRHLHSLSNESISTTFSHESLHSILDFDESALSPMAQGTSQNPFLVAGIPSSQSGMDPNGDVFTTGIPSLPSSSAHSAPSTGYVTPLVNSEAHSMEQPNFDSDVSDNSTTLEMITLSVLEGIEHAIAQAKEAISRGDLSGFNSHAQSVVTSADLIRGIGASASHSHSRFDQPSMVPSLWNNGHQIFSQSNSPVTSAAINECISSASPESALGSPPQNSTDNSEKDLQYAQAFRYGLSLLDIADPSRKRTISTATARASENDRAPKTQRRTQSKGDPGLSRKSSQTSAEHTSPTKASHSSHAPVSSSGPHTYDPSNFAQHPWPDTPFGSNAAVADVSLENHAAIRPFGHASLRSLPFTHMSSPLATHHGVRQSRSSSYSSTHPSNSSFAFEANVVGDSSQSSAPYSRAPSPDSYLSESELEAESEQLNGGRNGHGVHNDSNFRPSRRTAPGGEVINTSNFVPPDLKLRIDVVFDRYLQRVCSNLDATDAKGEPIHQTLMAKKMAKMDESLDFRPFKFRIAAFTNGFMEELAQHHLGEDVVPQKKVKAYLWHQQPIISRFNEDGKKSKSKGNHVWHIFAKRELDAGGWTFRPFERKILGNPTPIAYVGLRWSWQPRIWDPQMSRQSIQVKWDSPSLPSWLSWENDTLVGVPSATDANDFDIVVEASFPQEDRSPLRTAFHVQVVMFTISDQIMLKPKRPTPVGGNNVQARQTTSQAFIPTIQASDSSTPHPVPRDTDFIGVVTEASRQVAQAQAEAACSQEYPDTMNQQRQLSLARQQQVLVASAEALTATGLDGNVPNVSSGNEQLARVAQDLVDELARNSLIGSADAQRPPEHPRFLDAPTLAEGFKTTVARAVDRGDPLSSEVDVILAAQALARDRGQSGYQETSGPFVNQHHPKIDECQLKADHIPFQSDAEAPASIHPPSLIP